MKGFLVVIAVIVIILLIVTYIETGFNFSVIRHTTTTTIHRGGTTTVSNTPGGGGNATTSISSQLFVCDQVAISESNPNAIITERCMLTTDDIGVWAGAGSTGNVHIRFKGADNVTYINQTYYYSCPTFVENFTGPKQAYNLTVTTGPGGGLGTCASSIVKLNDTTVPTHQTYSFIYNGNFSNGAYTGWNVSGSGFGTAPLNLTFANNALIKCYYGKAWSNIPGTYVASTFRCGLQPTPGNLTSSPFMISEPFLNFKIVSSPSASLYIEVLANGKPAIIASYNTYNSSQSNQSSTFRNATIPLTTIGSKAATIRIVAGSVTQQQFVLAGGFYLSAKPYAREISPSNLTFLNTS